MIAYVNHVFLKEEKATLQVSDLAIQRGYATFDFFRIKDNCPLFLDDYLDRFYRSADFMHLHPVKSKEEVKEIIRELMEMNKLAESGMRLILTGGYSSDHYEPVSGNLLILQEKLQLPSQEKFATGVKVITYEYQRELPQIKSINYFMGIWLQQKLREQKAADVIYHKQGIVSELPRANILMVTKDQKILTPSKNILFGITRMKLLELAAKKYIVEEREVTISELINAEEVFMTSTTKRILPINQIDDFVIGNGKSGPVTALLNEEFIKIEDDYKSKR
ncbi:MAG: aminotransferase class IV [Bacteroidota bacterium]